MPCHAWGRFDPADRHGLRLVEETGLKANTAPGRGDGARASFGSPPGSLRGTARGTRVTGASVLGLAVGVMAG
jgi:hypothetical protein